MDTAKATYQVRVKQILSGDILVVQGDPKNGPPEEKTVQLAYVVAPKLQGLPGTATAGTPDEPFAWQSREALRKVVIGNLVTCVREYTDASNGRECVRMHTADDKDVAEFMAAHGWVKVDDRTEGDESFRESLRAMEQTAKASQDGLWSELEDRQAEAVRHPDWSMTIEASLVKPGEKCHAIVEEVNDAANLGVFLLPSFRYLHVHMTGIQCPGFTRSGDKIVSRMPFADEAKYFVERRLLQREVDVIIEGVATGAYYATVMHPNGNVAEMLVKEGMATIDKSSLSLVAGGPDKYLKAEKVAQSRRLRLYKDYKPPQPKIEDKEFYAKVVEIVNGETIMVKTDQGQFKRLTLASIRAPRPSEGGPIKSHFDVPYLYEEKNMMRKMLIGRKAKITVDFVRPAQDGYPERVGATVEIDNTNVAKALVAKGLCTVLHYRADDKQRSSHYEELEEAEKAATEARLGIHSEKMTKLRVNDISSNREAVKSHFHFLQRANRIRAVVEYVVNGSRLRVFIPRDSFLLTFVLAGVDCPRTGRRVGDKTEGGQPFANEATLFTKEMCLQHDVEIQVESMDRSGGLVGSLWVNNVNLAVSLVAEGLASVHFTADRLPYEAELRAAESVAKVARKNIWAGYVEEKPVVVDDTAQREVKYVEALVSEVASGARLYLQDVRQASKLDELQKKLNDLMAEQPAGASTVPPKIGDTVAARFTADNQWYRARVVRVGGGEVSVVFIDYGNTDKVRVSDVGTLPAGLSPRTVSPLATEVHLALVELPDDDDWLYEGALFMREGILEKKVKYNVEYTDGNTKYVTVIGPDGVDVAKPLLAAGLATVNRRPERRLAPLANEYTSMVDKAKEEHRNLWQYGDFVAEDAREFGYDVKKEEEKRKK